MKNATIKINDTVWGPGRNYLGTVTKITTDFGFTYARVEWGKEIGLLNHDIARIELLEKYEEN